MPALYLPNYLTTNQWDLIGLFLNISDTNFPTNVSQIFANFWVILKNGAFNVKTAVSTISAILWKIGLLFIPTFGHTATHPSHTY